MKIKKLSWDEVLGLAFVDGGTPSEYLMELIEKEKRGEIKREDMEEMIINYHLNNN